MATQLEDGNVSDAERKNFCSSTGSVCVLALDRGASDDVIKNSTERPARRA